MTEPTAGGQAAAAATPTERVQLVVLLWQLCQVSGAITLFNSPPSRTEHTRDERNTKTESEEER